MPLYVPDARHDWQATRWLDRGRFAQADSSVTRQKGGTGLGLAICKRLIELMNGRIGFADREQGGTVFHFDLPKHAA